MTAFDLALKFTLPQEGGFGDNPNDAGGATNHGITQATDDRYRNSRGELNQSVELLTSVEEADIYSQMYWMPAHCSELPTKLAICHFDWAVNHGVHGAICTLQEAVDVPTDGVFGPITRTAVGALTQDVILTSYLALRRNWYKQYASAHSTQREFLEGWLSRVKSLQQYLEAI